MADMKKEYDNLIIINLYISSVIRPWCTTTYAEGSGAEKFINFCLVWCDVVDCYTAAGGTDPSSIYSWYIVGGQILEHEFFCLGHFCSSGSREKKFDLSYSEQLLRVVF